MKELLYSALLFVLGRLILYLGFIFPLMVLLSPVAFLYALKFLITGTTALVYNKWNELNKEK